MTELLASAAAAAWIFVATGMLTGHSLYPPRWKRTP